MVGAAVLELMSCDDDMWRLGEFLGVQHPWRWSGEKDSIWQSPHLTATVVTFVKIDSWDAKGHSARGRERSL